MSDQHIKPSRWRRQHGRTEALDQVVDSNDNIGAPYRGLALLDLWERSGRITKEMRLAGDEFHRLFHIACLDPLYAADMSRVGGSPALPKHRGSMSARDEVHEAVAALGGPGSPSGTCAWFVLGCEYSIREWAAREIYRGRAMDKNVATGIVIGVLGGLKAHLGY